MTVPLSIADAKRRLLARSGRGAKYGLERIQEALKSVGHPEKGLPVIHVAGTNGKGSVCAMIEAMTRAGGLTTGLFTSPHLCRLNERIRLQGVPIDDERFLAALAVALSATPAVTFFEAVALAGFAAMSAVDVAIFEVGLGGRLDATNVVQRPRVTVITSIALDHTNLLGNTIVDIAREKGGIIKPEVPLIIGPVPREARATLTSIARAVGSGPITAVATSDAHAEQLGKDGCEVVQLSRRDDGFELSGAVAIHVPELGLMGRHQHENAATAAAAVAVDGRVPTSAMVSGLASVTWPGRLERLSVDGVTVWLDCAHNAHAAAAIEDALGDTLTDGNLHLVFGAMGDKAWPEMLRRLGRHAKSRHYCSPMKELAGRKPAALADLDRAHPGVAHPSVANAVDAALAAASATDTVLITGSIFLVGAARSHLTGEASDTAVPL